jgi:hypothetical protein
MWNLERSVRGESIEKELKRNRRYPVERAETKRQRNRKIVQEKEERSDIERNRKVKQEKE